MVRQFEIRDADRDGLLEGVEVRQFAVGSEAEGCVADDDRGVVYISEEEVGLWRYARGARRRHRTDRPSTRGRDGHLVADVEGVTLVDLPDGGGYVIASAQNVADPDNSFFVVYDRVTNAYVRSVRVTAGTVVRRLRPDRRHHRAPRPTSAPPFAHGIFVCQDNNNDAPGTAGNQNLKYVPLERVVDLDVGPPPPPPPPGDIDAGEHDVVNANSTRCWSRPVPAAVAHGDGMLCSSRGAPTRRR